MEDFSPAVSTNVDQQHFNTRLTRRLRADLPPRRPRQQDYREKQDSQKKNDDRKENDARRRKHNDQEKDDNNLTSSSHKQHIDAFFVYHVDTLILQHYTQLNRQHIDAIFAYKSLAHEHRFFHIKALFNGTNVVNLAASRTSRHSSSFATSTSRTSTPSSTTPTSSTFAASGVSRRSVSSAAPTRCTTTPTLCVP